MRLILITGIAIIAMLFHPTPVYADGQCGILCQIFGFDANLEERDRIAEDGETEREKIGAARDERIAQIEADAQRSKDLADQEVERIKQLRFQSESARDIAIAQANAARDQYVASIEAMKQQQIQIVSGETQKSLAAINSATQIGLESLNQVGETERHQMSLITGRDVVLLILGALIVLYWLYGRQKASARVLPPERPMLPGYDPRFLPQNQNQIDTHYQVRRYHDG